MRRTARPWRREAIAVAILATALGTADVRAQVSPGPLASAHRELDRLTLCFQCHSSGGSMTAKCVACHTEIGRLMTQNRGFHARVRGRECAQCHPDHAGADFRMITWSEGSPERFDHRRAGYALEGRHGSLECRDCHQPKNQRDAVAAKIRKKDRAGSWLGLDTRCAACHNDPHAGRFGAGCESCHGTTGWNAIRESGFDHDKTRYPLRGRHAAVACASCHDPARAFGKTPAFAACGDCHRDAHAGRATLAGRPADCASCHTVEGFDRTTYTVAQHRKSAYPLEGRHGEVACSSCHIRLGRGERAELVGTSGVLLRPLHDACARCHVDAHGGQPALAKRADRGACESCHTVRGFRPSAYAAASHAKLRLPLEGRHAAVACRACHDAARADLPPPRGAAQAGAARFVFAIAEVECAGCHFDPHGGRFTPGGARPTAGGCAACHGVSAWSPSRVDVAAHRRYRFPLDGAHGAVPCSGCHREMAGRAGRSSLVSAGAHPAPLRFAEDRRDCAACHESPHGTQFAKRSDKGACDACHEVDRFRPAARFDHDRDASFRLEGAHARVACAACHPSERGAKGTVRVVYRGVSGRCEACHAREDRNAKIGT